MEFGELKPMVLSCLDRVVVEANDDKPDTVLMRPNQVDLFRFLTTNLGTMNEICKRAGMFNKFIYDRSKAIFEQFGLPYEAERPTN